jgi:hypothetical protein
MAICKYGLSPITGTNDHWWDGTHAECVKCKEVFLHNNFYKQTNKKGKRPIHGMCKPCDSDYQFTRKRKIGMEKDKYNKYEKQMEKEGNECDMTYEEFLEMWPKDNRCPILGHKFRLFPKEERSKWRGGRHYPYTPCIDHIDPREPMSKDNLQIICWRANELKSDALPEEIHLLSIHMKSVLPMGQDVLNGISYKLDLERSEWVGK